MSDNGQRVPLPGCMIGPSEPCDAFQRQTARIAELEAELAAERWRREDIRANERRALREKLICAALTGLMGQTSASETWYAERAISQADAVLAALDREAAK